MIPFLCAVLFSPPDPVASVFSPAGRSFLESAERITIYEFRSTVFKVEETQVKRKQTLTRPVERRAALESIYASLRGSTLSMKCISPHHALVAQRGRRKMTLMLCYSCGWMTIMEPNGHRPNASFGRAGYATFDRLLGR